MSKSELSYVIGEGYYEVTFYAPNGAKITRCFSNYRKARAFGYKIKFSKQCVLVATTGLFL